MKKILSCILAGAMLVSSVGAVSVFAADPKTCDTQSQTVATYESDTPKCKEAKIDTKLKSWRSTSSVAKIVALDVAVDVVMGASLLGVVALSNSVFGTSFSLNYCLKQIERSSIVTTYIDLAAHYYKDQITSHQISTLVILGSLISDLTTIYL